MFNKKKELRNSNETRNINEFKKEFNLLDYNEQENFDDGTYDKTIYNILSQINLETVNVPEPNSTFGRLKNLSNVTRQEFIDELFIAFRSLFIAEISIDKSDTIGIKFSDDCQFKIRVMEF